MSRFLTKSLFVHALDCPTKLFYKTHSDEYSSKQDDDDFLKTLAEGGLQVGELAKQYHPDGIEIDYSHDKEDSLKRTLELLEQDNVTIFEAAVSHQRTYVLVDILVKKGKVIDLIEVKSKSWPPKPIDSVIKNDGTMRITWQKYYFDVAFQTWVLRKAFPGYTIRPKLMLIYKEVPVTMDGLHQYFKITTNEKGRSEVRLTEDLANIPLGDPIMITLDVSEEVELILSGKARQPENELEAKGFDSWVEGLCTLIEKDKKYPVQIGAKCRNCEHRVADDKLEGKKAGFNECWKEALNWTDKEFQKPHAFDVWQASSSTNMKNGIYFMEELTPEYFGVEEKTLYQQPIWDNGYKQRQLAQVMKMTGRHEDREVILPGLFHEMDRWTYPLHFIDFEGIAPAIPFHKGSYPYKKIPFQFSVHDVHEDGRVVHAAEWVDKRKGVYPGFDFVRQLKKVLEKGQGSVFMYHHYERTTLRDVKSLLLDSEEPDRNELVDWIDTLVAEGSERELIDQQKLVLRYYYSVHMKGSNSIKDVLPAVLKESDVLKKIYSEPYSGLSLKEKVLYEEDINGELINPYSLLEPVGYGIPNETELAGVDFDLDDRIQEGGTAMMAWARMQFDDVTEQEREQVFQALLRYCELDTLAMVMIYQHWKSMK